MADYYILYPTLAALERYEESRQVEYVNRHDVLEEMYRGMAEPPDFADDEKNIIVIQPEARPLGTPLAAARWRFDDASILPDIWGHADVFIVSKHFRDVAQVPFANAETFDVEVSGKAASAAEAKDYQMLRLGRMEHDALDMERTSTEVFQRFRRIHEHVFREDFVPAGPMFMTPQSVYTFVTADLADRIQCAGITDVEFRDPTVHDPVVGYVPKPMPEDCP